MAKSPAGASLLFGALADSGRIRQRKNGSYKMVLKGVDEINWFTDHPERVAGKWKTRKLLRKWNSYFSISEPNAQAGFKADDVQKMVTFEMFKPKMKKGKMVFTIKSISDAEKDLLTGLKGKELDHVSLFIDESSATRPCTLNGTYLKSANLSDAKLTGADLSHTNWIEVNLVGANLKFAKLTEANLIGADLYGANLTGANLYGAKLHGTNLTDASLNGANLTGANLTDANLKGATYNSDTYWGSSDTILPEGTIWNDTTCPNGTNSDSNPSCGF